MILLMLQFLSSIGDRLLVGAKLAPQWFAKYRLTTFPLNFMVMGTALFVYAIKLGGWSQADRNVDFKKLERERAEARKVMDEVYQNSGVRPPAKEAKDESDDKGDD